MRSVDALDATVGDRVVGTARVIAQPCQTACMPAQSGNALSCMSHFSHPDSALFILMSSCVIPGSITVCSNHRKLYMDRPTLGLWGTMLAILRDSAEIRSHL